MYFMKKRLFFCKEPSAGVGKGHFFGTARTKLMAEPNNILALEYLKRMVYWREQGHPMKAVTVKRYGSGDFEKNGASGYAGASAIRRMIEDDAVGLKNYVPESVRMQSLLQLTFRLPWRRRCSGFCGVGLIRAHEELSEIYCMGHSQQVEKGDRFG